MRILIDTNILISAILGHGLPSQAYLKAVSFPNRGIISTVNVDELRRIFNRKFPQKVDAMEHFLSVVLQSVELVQVPDLSVPQEEFIRDINDRPIMRAAVAAKCDAIVTGDKDFLESGIATPKILSARDLVYGFGTC